MSLESFGHKRIFKVKGAFSLLIVGPRVCNMKSTYGKP